MMKGPILIKIAQMIEFVWEIQWVSRKIDFYFFSFFLKILKFQFFSQQKIKFSIFLFHNKKYNSQCNRV